MTYEAAIEKMRAPGCATRCLICGADRGVALMELPFAMKGRAASTVIVRCGRCRTYARLFEEPLDLNEHWDIRSYTSLEHEEEFKRARLSFFKSLASWSLAHLPDRNQGPRVLDVGCSYGHLLEVFRHHGCECFGVEPVDRLRNRLNREGRFMVYPSLQDIPDGSASYDVVTLIDSLYYFEDPLSGLKKVAEHLSDSGVLVIRVTNRTPLLDAWHRLGGAITEKLFGDQLFAFSHPGMLALLGKTGLTVEGLRFFEHKPLTGRGLPGFLYYGLIPAFCAVTRLKLTPGLTYLAKRKREAVPAPITAGGNYPAQAS